VVDRAYRLFEQALEAAEGQVDDEVHVFMTGGALHDVKRWGLGTLYRLLLPV